MAIACSSREPPLASTAFKLAPEEGLAPKSTVFANDLEAVSSDIQSNQACSLTTFPNSVTAGY
jgi:hypothetical protein